MTWLRRCVLIAGTEVTVQVSLARYIYCTVLSSSISVVSDCLEKMASLRIRCSRRILQPKMLRLLVNYLFSNYEIMR